jgi:hypothetical protein
MAALSTNNMTLLDLAKRTDPNGGIAKVVEILDQTNELIQFLPFIEGNLPTGHLTTIRTGLPPVTWTTLYSGVTPGKSTTVQVTETVGRMEAFSEVDDRLLQLAKDKAAARFTEEKAQIESFAQEMVRAIFYENVTTNPERFTGLAPRYNTLSTATAANAENVITGGGGGSDNASIWLLVLGEDTIHGLIPQGASAGLTIEDLGKQVIEDASNGSNTGRMMAWRTHYEQKLGICVRDWRYGVRIPNIDKSALLADASSGANLPRLIHEAMNLIPSMSRGRAVLCMSRYVRTRLGQQLSEGTKNSSLMREEVGGKMVDTFQGVPVLRVDALAADEAAVS